VRPLSPLGGATQAFRARTGAEAAPAFAPDPTDWEPWYLGWELARCASGLSPEERRALAALVAATVASIRAGSTRLPLEGPGFAAALALVGAEGEREATQTLVGRARTGLALDPVTAVIGRAGDRRPLIVEGRWLYAERMRALEERLCARIRERAAQPLLERAAAQEGARAISRAIASLAPSMTLTEEQKRAVREGLRAPLALITGGPGTGKTTTVVALVRAIAWLGAHPLDAIAIAAPTGKAAQRLSDAIASGLARAARDLSDAALRSSAPAPVTLHRLLGWSPSTGRFGRHENDPLPHRLVIVDEASMIDLAMMDRLLRALKPEARLVLLGDADQLPSVEAGAVFRDLCAALDPVALTANLRVADDANARRIVATARAVNRGTLEGVESIVVRRSVDDLTFRGVEHLDCSWTEVGEAMLDRWWARRLAADAEFGRRATHDYRLTDGAVDERDAADLSALHAFHGRARILCATRTLALPSSAQAINERMLVRLRASAARERRRPPYPSGGRTRDPAPGAPVLVERNDYTRGLFNGDQGVLVRAAAADESDGAEQATPMVAFARSGSFELFPFDALPDLTPAFAMTVHKAQGSEFDEVVLVLPDADVPLMTRELVYTAITRARHAVVIVGRAELLARAVSRTTERFSGVADRLST
jgi:exodeoxyribonuclease V alpha subunit